MLKFLRKYNKIILTVGGTLLLITFLIPQALQQAGQNQANRTVARMDGRAITARQVAEANQEMELAQQALGLSLEAFFQNSGQGELLGGLHWLMLVREAEAAGFVGGPSSGTDMIGEMARLYAVEEVQRTRQNVPEQVILERVSAYQTLLEERYRATAGTYGAERVNTALSRVRGVFALLDAVARAPRVSEVSLRRLADDVLQQVSVDFAVLRARDEGLRLPEPDEDAMRAHFEAYKAVAPGTGEFGFGYLQPSAIRAEWLVLERAAFESAVKPDPIEVRKRWQADRTRYPGEFPAERARVEADLRASLAQQALAEADQIIRAEGVQELRGVPDAGRWKDLPADWFSRVRPMADIAKATSDRLQARLGSRVEIRHERRDDWMTRPMLEANPALSSASVQVGARVDAFPNILPEIREIGGREARGPQAGVLTGPARDAAGNVVYFRILGARREGPPASLDEVRGRVSADLRALRAFEQLKADAEAIRSNAASMGLEAAVREFTGVTVAPFGIVTRSGPAILDPDIDDPAVREAVFAAARGLDPTRPVADTPADARIVAVPVQRTMTLAVVEIRGLEPVTAETFETTRFGLERRGAELAAGGMRSRPFAFERMRERHAFEVVGGEMEETPAEQPGSAPGEPAAPAAPAG